MIIEQPQLYILLRTPTLNGGTPAKTMQKIALNMFDIHFRSAAVWEGKLMDLTYYVLTHSLAFLSRPTFLSGSNRFVFFHKWIWKDNLDLRVRNHNIPLLTNHSFSLASKLYDTLPTTNWVCWISRCHRDTLTRSILCIIVVYH